MGIRGHSNFGTGVIYPAERAMLLVAGGGCSVGSVGLSDSHSKLWSNLM